jgi:bifunctional non-homologous end joining protein LigD
MLARNIRTDGFVDPCIPARAAKAPAGEGWVHEVKHGGYRLIVRRDGETVRLFTRRGYDWTDRYPAIAAAATKLKARSFTLDGEAVVADADGVAVFDALHRRGRVTDAILQAFDLLELDGEDLRPLPLVKRKPRLARCWPACGSGSPSTHTDENGALVFLHACKMGPALPGSGSRSRTRTVRRDSGNSAPMGVRTRGMDIAINAKWQVADAAARAEAKAVIERWNEPARPLPRHRRRDLR